MSDLPWVRFFPSDWLGGTRAMSAAETGVYITLIATMYERKEPIAEDHARLARLCGATKSTFSKTLDLLVDEGKIVRVDAGLWNKKVEKECAFRAEKVEASRTAANTRWSKKYNKNNSGKDAGAMRKQCAGNANQKPDPDKEKVEKENPDIGAVEAWAKEQGFHINIRAEADKYADWLKTSGKRHKDKTAGLRNWCRKAADYANKDSPRDDFGVAPVMSSNRTSGPYRNMTIDRLRAEGKIQ